MTRTPAIPAPEVPGIDLTFRPASYFWPLGLETHLLARIKGAERKEAVRRQIDAGGLDSVPELLLQSALSDEMRQALGRIHPSMMGGEYLPNLTRNEVDIARIRIDSTTQDVTSVYASRGKNRISYRVVDEYHSETLSEKQRRASTRPLTLGALETFLNDAWSIFDVLEGNFANDGYVVDEMLAFTKVESQFYPQITTLYRHRIEAWAAAQQAEQGIGRSDESIEEAASPVSRND